MLREYLRENGIGQIDFANKIGVSVVFINYSKTHFMYK